MFYPDSITAHFGAISYDLDRNPVDTPADDVSFDGDAQTGSGAIFIDDGGNKKKINWKVFSITNVLTETQLLTLVGLTIRGKRYDILNYWRHSLQLEIWV